MRRFTSLVALAATSAALGVANAAPTIQATLTLGNQSPVLCTDIALAKAFVPNFADGTLSVIDLDSLTVAATVAVGPNPKTKFGDAFDPSHVDSINKLSKANLG